MSYTINIQPAVETPIGPLKSSFVLHHMHGLSLELHDMTTIMIEQQTIPNKTSWEQTILRCYMAIEISGQIPNISDIWESNHVTVTFLCFYHFLQY